jgi:hypothetical protein
MLSTKKNFRTHPPPFANVPTQSEIADSLKIK